MLVDQVAIIEKLVVEEGIGDKHLEKFNEELTEEFAYLTDRYQDVEKLTEEETEGVFVELIVNMLEIVFEQNFLLLLRLLNYSSCIDMSQVICCTKLTIITLMTFHKKIHEAALHREPYTAGDVENNSLKKLLLLLKALGVSLLQT